MRLGIIGCGAIVEREHAPALRGARGVEVVAVADPVPERARLVGRAFGLAESDCLGDPRRLIERNDIDAVSIATPPNVRTELAGWRQRPASTLFVRSLSRRRSPRQTR